jgi:hypothetical protein
MKYKILLAAMLASCGSPQTQLLPGINGINGVDGADGADGVNGLALISQARTATALECPSSTGTAIDVYQDTDSSGTVSAGDVFQSGLVSCNGTDGNNSVASVTSFNFTNHVSCFDLGNNFSAKKSSTTANDVRIYPNSSCSGSHVNSLAEGSDEVFQVTDNMLLILEGNNSGTIAPLTIRRILFNL